MALNDKQISTLFTDIRTGKAALLLGQEYFTIDDNYYNKVLNELGITNETPSLNKLWKEKRDSLKELEKALISAAEHVEYKSWLRSICSLGWNIILSSSICNQWIKNSVGNNFGLTIQTQDELIEDINFYKTFNKNKLHFISLYSDEESIPDQKKLLKLKKQTNLINIVYNQILSGYNGCLVIDGIADDDWFDMSRLLENIDLLPYGCIYIFGMDKGKLERTCNNEDDWTLLQECIDNSQIILHDYSLKDTVTEFGMVDEFEEEEEFEHNDEVRISFLNNDSMWVPRRECTRLNRMGVTLMRDEILTQLILNDNNKEKYFADFLQQHDKKSWNYFDVVYKKEKTTFHIPREVEGYLENAVTNQLGSSNNKREIILLKGNSNSGKTTSLSWFAWHAVKEGLNKKKNNKFIVLYISGNPTRYENDWQDILLEFIKNNIYKKNTTKGDRIRNVIVIWDNYNSTSKKSEYVRLYNKLNECNAILIGSIYSFESFSNDSSIVQGIAFNELKPLKSKLDDNASIKLKKLLQMINQQWAYQLSQFNSKYLFENIINLAKFNYSPEWAMVKDTLRARLSKESIRTETVSNELFNIFKDRNADNIIDVRKTVLSLGIGATTQSSFMCVDAERQSRNEQFINSIRDMNLILAVVGQFIKNVKLPISVLLRTIIKEKQYKGEYKKLNTILRSDSMVEYETNTSTGNTMVSFRHPSEAIAYLDNNFGTDRKEEEIKVIIRLIKNCNWDEYEEAKAVGAIVRSFGTNSYGKYNGNPPRRGQFNEYSEYWNIIVEDLRSCASSNPEAMLIAGHFTRDYVQQHQTSNHIDTLEDALDGMRQAVESCDIKSTCSRLYGEMCRNLLQQMKYTDDYNKLEYLFNDFENYFESAVKNGKESKRSNNSFPMIQLLDIWLNYVLYNKYDQEVLLPNTLEYIDLLFYDESNLIDDTEDYVSVVSNINTIYDIVDNSHPDNLYEIFKNAKNDSYIYCTIKQILVKLFLSSKEKYPELFGGNDHVLSGRVFFLNENAANDFEQFKTIKTIDTINTNFNEIKQELKTASEKIINKLQEEYSRIEDMTFRCLVLYLKAKWMYYTGNLLLENEQYPALSNEKWSELNRICRAIQANSGDNDVLPRSVGFIQNIYNFAFEGKRWEQHRYNSESPNRLICLCTQNNNSKGFPRLFRVSVKENSNNKLFASIDYEISDGQKIKTAVVGQKNIFVPENIKNYRDLKNSNLNIDRNFVIWFNLGGPQIQDNTHNEEV